MPKLQLQIQVYIAVTLLIFLGVFYVQSLNQKIKDLEKELTRVEEMARNQSRIDQATVRVTDTVAQRDRHVSTQAARAIVDVLSTPGATEMVPSGISDAWRAAIIGLRDRAANDLSASDSPGDPEEQMP